MIRELRSQNKLFRGGFDDSINETTKASSIFRDLGDAKGQTLSRTNLAELYLRMGEPDIALEHAEAAISIDKTQIPITVYGEAQRVYADVLLVQGEPRLALKFAQQALDSLRKPNTIADDPNTFFERGRLSYDCRDRRDDDRRASPFCALVCAII